jgi:hypothetical protein
MATFVPFMKARLQGPRALEAAKKGCRTAMKWIKVLGCLVFLSATPLAFAQIQVGETQVRSTGIVTAGYSGNFGDDIQGSHGLDLGGSNDISGSYYSPTFLNFDVDPYYNESRADSNYQSLTNASGVAATANFFTGSHFPGSVSYHYDYNSTGTFGLEGTPNFTTKGNGDGLGLNWSALVPNLPTLSVGYQQGSGSGSLYGTDQETSSDQHLFNVHSSYELFGFRLNAYYDHSSLNTSFPEFLTNGDDKSDSSGQDLGVNASRTLPWWHGSMYTGYNHSSYSTDYLVASEQNTTTSGYSADSESSGAAFHPAQKLSLSFSQDYTSNLSAYLNQSLVDSGPNLNPAVNLGAGSYSNTIGGGATYLFTNNLAGSAQATRYEQSYFGNSYSGTFMSGNVNYGRRLLNMFTFSAGMVDSSSNFGNNNVGFQGTVNYFHRFGEWESSGSFTYAQNVQSVLITETSSYYNYNANVHRKFSTRVQWTAAVNGSHSGLSTDENGSSSSEGYTTSLSLRRIAASALYSRGNGNSILTSAGLVSVPLLPGETGPGVIQYNAKSYGGSVSLTPIARMSVTGMFSRSISDTLSEGVVSRNNTEIFYSQLQYRMRRISLLAGYTRFSQGFSAAGPTGAPVTSYYVGVSRWFNFF